MMQLCVVIPILVPQRAQYSVGDVTIPRKKEQKAITPYVRFLGVFQVCEKKRNAYFYTLGINLTLIKCVAINLLTRCAHFVVEFH